MQAQQRQPASASPHSSGSKRRRSDSPSDPNSGDGPSGRPARRARTGAGPLNQAPPQLEGAGAGAGPQTRDRDQPQNGHQEPAGAGAGTRPQGQDADQQLNQDWHPDQGHQQPAGAPARSPPPAEPLDDQAAGTSSQYHTPPEHATQATADAPENPPGQLPSQLLGQLPLGHSLHPPDAAGAGFPVPPPAHPESSHEENEQKPDPQLLLAQLAHERSQGSAELLPPTQAGGEGWEGDEAEQKPLGLLALGHAAAHEPTPGESCRGWIICPPQASRFLLLLYNSC